MAACLALTAPVSHAQVEYLTWSSVVNYNLYANPPTLWYLFDHPIDPESVNAQNAVLWKVTPLPSGNWTSQVVSVAKTATVSPYSRYMVQVIPNAPLELNTGGSNYVLEISGLRSVPPPRYSQPEGFNNLGFRLVPPNGCSAPRPFNMSASSIANGSVVSTAARTITMTFSTNGSPTSIIADSARGGLNIQMYKYVRSYPNPLEPDGWTYRLDPEAVWLTPSNVSVNGDTVSTTVPALEPNTRYMLVVWNLRATGYYGTSFCAASTGYQENPAILEFSTTGDSCSVAPLAGTGSRSVGNTFSNSYGSNRDDIVYERGRQYSFETPMHITNNTSNGPFINDSATVSFAGLSRTVYRSVDDYRIDVGMSVKVEGIKYVPTGCNTGQWRADRITFTQRVYSNPWVTTVVGTYTNHPLPNPTTCSVAFNFPGSVSEGQWLTSDTSSCGMLPWSPAS